MLWRAALVLIAAAAALAPVPASFVERVYSTNLYPRIQAVVTSLSNRAPFALFDVLVCVTLSGALVALIADVRSARGAWVGLLRFGRRALVATAVFYLAFLVCWGLNYRREKLKDRLQFDCAAVTPESAARVVATSVDALNALHDRAHAGGWPPFGSPDAPLSAAFRRTQVEIGGRPTVVSRPKYTVLDPYFRLAGVSGMTNPYFLETLVQRNLLPFERPFVVAHEWGHLAGLADESEASFFGWLTCLRGSVADQYSGWLFAYDELLGGVGARDRADLASKLASGPRADLRAIDARVARSVSPTVSTAGWRVYDRYLKANRIEAGAANYDEVVQLMLGVRFGRDWTPLSK